MKFRTVIAGLFAITGAGCKNAPRIDLRLIHNDDLSLDRSMDITVTLRSADDDAEVLRTVLEDTTLGGPTRAFDATVMAEGARYYVAVSATTPSCIVTERAVGRSLPFVHREGAYGVSIQFGCADQIGRTVGRLAQSRVVATGRAFDDGRVLLYGGATQTGSVPDADIVFGDRAEVYDSATGQFAALAPGLGGGAIVASSISLGARVLIAGGLVRAGGVLSCATTLELWSAEGRVAQSALEQARCAPVLSPLSGGRVLAVGGGAVLPPAELIPRDLAAAPEAVRAGSARWLAVGTKLAGDRTLVVGANGTLGRPAEVFDASGTDVVTRAITTATPTEPTWGEQTLTYVPCPGGGGAAYILGGRTGMTPATALTGVWCYRDEPGVDGEIIAMTPALPEPRHLHGAAWVRGRDGPRLLVVGGLRSDGSPTPGHQQALLARVSGCECAIDGEWEPFDSVDDGFALIPTVTPLPDGAVLITGVVEVDVPIYRASDTAFLFIPDLDP